MFSKQITLDVDEFIRRFMQHILPCGFYKIRYFGIMALCNGQEKNALCFELIDKDSLLPVLEGLPALDVYREVTGKDPLYCTNCKKGKMRPISIVANKQMEPG